MFLNKIFIGLLTTSLVCALSGCDYRESNKQVDELRQQQEKLSARIDLFEQQKARLELIEKRQALIINSTRTLTTILNEIKKQQDTFVFTEFNPSQTKYFILNNGSVGLAGRVLSIDATDNGSIIHMSLVNLLSIPVANIGFHATWGGEKPTDPNAFAKWQQLLFSTSMNSTLKLLPGQWQDINLTLKGVSPNNLKYLKLAINMDSIQFDNPQPAESQRKKSKK